MIILSHFVRLTYNISAVLFKLIRDPSFCLFERVALVSLERHNIVTLSMNYLLSD